MSCYWWLEAETLMRKTEVRKCWDWKWEMGHIWNIPNWVWNILMGISSFFESRVSLFVSNVDGHCHSYHYEQVNVNWGTRLLSHWQFWNRNGNMKLHKRRWPLCHQDRRGFGLRKWGWHFKIGELTNDNSAFAVMTVKKVGCKATFDDSTYKKGRSWLILTKNLLMFEKSGIHHFLTQAVRKTSNG
jgi:hypothetical protein